MGFILVIIVVLYGFGRFMNPRRTLQDFSDSVKYLNQSIDEFKEAKENFKEAKANWNRASEEQNKQNNNQ